MKKHRQSHNLMHRLLAFALAFVMVLSYLPGTTPTASAADGIPGTITTVADPGTLTRPETIYGNDTENAGKVTVGKSVSTENETVVLGGHSFQASDNNFLVTISQSAQIMGLTSEMSIPVDVVFVLDTSGSMYESSGWNTVDRFTPMVNAANSAISFLMEANENNRVGVVAFSDDDSGGGTSNDDAANVLSSLAHYTGDAATNHLQRVDRDGDPRRNGDYVAGRDTVTVGSGWNQRTVNAYRHGHEGATHIQAGIYLGAKMLMDVASTDTYITDDEGNKINRMPFIIVLSDGSPTRVASTSNWYTPSMTDQLGSGNDDNNYAGLGFLPALTAAYYKGAITEHYYGSNASEENRCSIYTLGVMIDSLSQDSENLANVTMNPKDNLSNTSNSYANTFNYYWYAYSAPFTYWDDGFNITVNGSGTRNFKITEASIAATRNYVNGISSTGAKMYKGGLAYNDGYYNASATSEINGIFDNVMQEISEKGLAAPTAVDETHGDQFSGYVTFTDLIGEYMEVKDMKGIVADGNFYQGASFARLFSNYGKSSTQEQVEFDAAIKNVLQKRLVLSGSSADFNMDNYIAQVQASANQGYYNSAADFDNSMVWWGKAAPSENGEQTVQLLGFADDDSIEYITNTAAPEGANVVCRSYYFHGTAGGTAINPNTEYMYFVVRVQRSLEAPYQQTVVISAPARLLSTEKVMIHEALDDSGNTVYTATVEKSAPARVVYEVGLRSDINAGNVAAIVSDSYKNEQVNGIGSANYDPVTNTYRFFTNDWDRSQSADSHHRPLTKATFNAADSNSFYTYQEDTKLLNADGTAYTGGQPTGRLYYARDVYSWSGTPNAEGDYAATKSSVLVQVNLTGTEDSSVIKQVGSEWFIAKGVHTASTLVVNGDDTVKAINATGTSAIVAHPHRTGSADDSHYTVYLGNNGMLSIVPEKLKTVAINDSLTDDDGKLIMIGDELTYTIKAVNSESSQATVTITDKVPAGTEFVSASNGGTLDSATGVVTWNLQVAAGESVTVSFKVKVTRAALDLGVTSVDNAATIQLGNNPAYTTNTTSNPPEGKNVSDADGNIIEGNVQVGDILSYSIHYVNDEDTAATVTITDIIPEGTAYIPNTATHNGVYDAAAGTLTWVIENVQPGTSGVVTFRVQVIPQAIDDGTEEIRNKADIKVGDNDPRQTNDTVQLRDKGSLQLSKLVDANGNSPSAATQFTIKLQESTGTLNGTYSGVTFVNGAASVLLRGGESVTIENLPTGTMFYVTEESANGYTPSFQVTGSGIANASVLMLADVSTIAVVPVNSTVSVEVTNDYNPAPVAFQVKGSKTFTGEDFPNGTFAFQAQLCNAQGQVITGADAVTVTAAATYDGTANTVNFAFSNRVFTAGEVGTRYYLLSEMPTNLVGVTVDDVQYLLKLTISDNGEGQLVVEAELASREGTSGSFSAFAAYDWENERIAFENVYKPLRTQLTLGGDKVLSGRYFQNGEFGFELVENGNPIATAMVVNDGSDNVGTYTFPAIAYTEEGTHTYIIREVKGGLANTEYDKTYYQVTVVVADVNGQLVATPTVVKFPNGEGSGVSSSVDALDFTNVYTSDGASVTFEGTKTLTGAAANGLNAGDFYFTVYASDATGTSLGEIVADGANVASAPGSNTASIRFSAISYDAQDMRNGSGGYLASKDFYYVVKEDIPGTDAPTFDPNMYYDTGSFLVKVTVTYATNGTMTAEVTSVSKLGGTGSTIAFTNVKNPADVSVGIQVSKTTQDPQLEDVYFSITVEDVQGVDPVAGGSVEANAGATVVDNQTYTAPGVHYYWIYESEYAGQTVNGITYDNARYLAVVTVTRNASNKLEAQVKYYAAGTVADGKTLADAQAYAAGPEVVVSFNNTYAAIGSANLSAYKTMIGRDQKAAEFTFVLERLTGLGGTAEFTRYATNDANGNVHFPTLFFTEAHAAAGDAFYYHIYEQQGSVPGVTYGTAEYWVKVAVADDGNGNIIATPTYYSDAACTQEVAPEDVKVTNSYAPVHGTSATIEAAKNLIGRALEDGEFNFLLELKDAAAATGWREVVRTTNVGGKVSFLRNYPANLDASYFDANDTATLIYRISEIKGNLGGVAYSDQVYYVKVIIKHDTDSASLVLDSVSYYTDAACTNAASSVVFTNTYATTGTSIVPQAGKVLQGANGTALNMAANRFSFEVLELDGPNGNVTGTVSVGANDASGNVAFSPIGYTEAGTYYYAVVEAAGTEATVTYDTAKYYLTVVVEDNGAGKLEVKSQTYTDVNGGTVQKPLFTNHYGPGSVNLDLELVKEMGTKISSELFNYKLNGSEFDFNVYVNDNGQPGALVTTGSNTAGSNGTAAIIFGSIQYTRADVYGVGNPMVGPKSATFKYIIQEIAPRNGAESGIESDPDWIHVTVTVTDDGYGNLTTDAVFTDENGVVNNDKTFTNIYHPDPAVLHIPVEKILRNKELGAADRFTFILNDGTNQISVQNDAQGRAVFSLSYAPADMIGATRINGVLTKVFTYTLYESSTMPGSTTGTYQPDATVYNVTVTVTDNGNGKLEAAAVYQRGGSTVDVVQFTNSYVPNPITEDLSLKIGATKQVVDAAGQPLNGKLAGFRFQVTDISGKVLGANEGVSAADGTISFGAFTFDTAGEYHYIISEINEGADGFTYTEDKWEVQILVSYNRTTGKLYIGANDVVCTKVGAADTTHAAPAFVNVYQPIPTGLTIIAEKSLTGRDLRDGEFTFHLLLDGILQAEATNRADGTISFPVTFTEPGVYDFKIQEYRPEKGLGGVSYDTNIYSTPTIVVTDNNSKLTASVNSNVVDNVTVSSGATITNIYTAKDVEVEINASKQLIGRPMNAGEFEFEILDAVGKVVATGTNDALGNITFEKLVYQHTDLKGAVSKNFNYTIVEKDPASPSVTHDPRAFSMIVVVTDDLNGQLKAEVIYPGEVLFQNKYQPDDETITIVAKKEFTDGQLLGDDFEFVLTDADGKEIEVVKNDGQGNITFSQIVYTLDDLDGEVSKDFVYTVREKIPTDRVDGVIYDETVYTVVVTVEDDRAAGELKVTKLVNNSPNTEIVYVNSNHEILVKDAEKAGTVDISIDGQKVSVGDQITYTLGYTNTTGKDVTATITDTLPAYTSFVGADNGGVHSSGVVTWELPVAKNGSVEVTVTVKVDAPQEIYSNTANVFDGTNTYSSNEVHNHTVEEILVKDVALVSAPEISIDGEKVNVGDQLVYTIIYANVTDQVANVTIADQIPEHTTFVSADNNGVFADGTLTWALTVQPWSTETVSFVVEVADPDAFVLNQATAFDGVNNYNSNETFNHTYEEIGGKDVVLSSAPTVSVDGRIVALGDELTYTITYVNTETAKQTVTIEDTIPGYTALVEGSAVGATYADGKLTWVMEVESMETVTVSFKVKVVGAGELITNQAMVLEGNNTYLTNKVTNSVPEKVVDKTAASTGEVLTYTITYVNASAAAEDVTITDTLSSMVTYVEGSAVDATYANGVLTWNFTDVPSGEKIVVSFQVKVNSDAAASVSNTADVVVNDVKITTESAETTVSRPTVEALKEQRVGSGSFTTELVNVEGGEIVTYRITVSNTGDGDAYGITVSDVIPAGLTLVNGSINANGTLVGATVVWEIQTLAAGESVQLSFQVKVPAVKEITVWENIASVTYENEDPDDEGGESNKVEIEEIPTVTPDTGDNSPLLLLTVLMATSAAALVLLMISNKRRKQA